MKLDDILAEWEKDAKINPTNLGSEAIKIPQLHNKYYRIYVHEKLILRKYIEDSKALKLAKFEFYTMGPTEETHAKGWQLPPQGRVVNAQANTYVDSDKDVINLNLKLGIQHEKVDLLDSIIKSLVNRGFQIKTAVDYEKFKVGAY
jgi:hypothetical protein